MGKDFAAQEGFDSAFLQQRDLFRVAQIAVWLVFHDLAPAADGCLEQAAQGLQFDLP